MISTRLFGHMLNTRRALKIREFTELMEAENLSAAICLLTGVQVGLARAENESPTPQKGQGDHGHRDTGATKGRKGRNKGKPRNKGGAKSHVNAQTTTRSVDSVPGHLEYDLMNTSRIQPAQPTSRPTLSSAPIIPSLPPIRPSRQNHSSPACTASHNTPSKPGGQGDSDGDSGCLTDCIKSSCT